LKDRYKYRTVNCHTSDMENLDARCTLLYSEDMQHGQVIEKSLTIRNPFKS